MVDQFKCLSVEDLSRVTLHRQGTELAGQRRIMSSFLLQNEGGRTKLEQIPGEGLEVVNSHGSGE